MTCNFGNSGELLSVPRGTTASFALTIIDKDSGQPYELETGQVLIFAVTNNMRDPLNNRVIIKKISNAVNDEYYLELTPDDTAELPIGKLYWYSIGLQSSNDVLYPIFGNDWGPFEITPYAVKLGDGV